MHHPDTSQRRPSGPTGSNTPARRVVGSSLSVLGRTPRHDRAGVLFGPQLSQKTSQSGRALPGMTPGNRCPYCRFTGFGHAIDTRQGISSDMIPGPLRPIATRYRWDSCGLNRPTKRTTHMAAPKRNRENYNAYMREYMKDRYHKRRAKAVRMMGGACHDCGETEGLEFDHVNRHAKSFDIGKRLCSAPWDVLWQELRKCVLRCQDCHQVKTVENDMERWSLNNERLIAHRDRVLGDQFDLFAA